MSTCGYSPPQRTNVVLTLEYEYSPPPRTNVVLIIECPRMKFKEISDSAKVVELPLRRHPRKSFSDSFKGYDYKGFVIPILDAFSGRDYKGFVVSLPDVLVTYDLLEYIRGRVIVLRDSFLDEGFIRTGFGKWFSDSVVASDVRVSKVPVKAVLDSFRGADLLVKSVVSHVYDVLIVCDAVSKDLYLVSADLVKGRDFKGFVIQPVDVVKGVDFGEFFKTLYKTVQDAVRGVDYLSKTLGFRRDLVDVSKVSDLFSKGVVRSTSDVGRASDVLYYYFGKTLVDSVSVADRGVRDVTRVFSDVGLVSDLMEQIRGRVVELRDTLVDEGYMSKGILWHFREWWITVKDYGPFKEFGKRIMDSARVYDYKGFVIQPRELIGSADWMLKEVEKAILESVKPVELVSKDVLAHVFEAWRIEERIEKYYRGVLEISDVASSVDFFSKSVTSAFRDAVRAYDYKGFVSELLDAVRAFDPKVIAAKGIVLEVMDRFVDEGWVAKVPARGLRDAVKPSDFLLKVAFTLFGEAARRVYFHKVHGDIILPEDHNVRNLAAQALVEAVKKLKDKLNQM